MLITVYAHASAESIYETAKAAGMSDEAANYFRFADEYKLELDVNLETGEVVEVRAIYP